MTYRLEYQKGTVSNGYVEVYRVVDESNNETIAYTYRLRVAEQLVEMLNADTQPSGYREEMVEKILSAAASEPVASFDNLEDYERWQDSLEDKSSEIPDANTLVELIGDTWQHAKIHSNSPRWAVYNAIRPYLRQSDNSCRLCGSHGKPCDCEQSYLALKDAYADLVKRQPEPVAVSLETCAKAVMKNLYEAMQSQPNWTAQGGKLDCSEIAKTVLDAANVRYVE